MRKACYTVHKNTTADVIVDSSWNTDDNQWMRHVSCHVMGRSQIDRFSWTYIVLFQCIHWWTSGCTSGFTVPLARMSDRGPDWKPDQVPGQMLDRATSKMSVRATSKMLDRAPHRMSDRARGKMLDPATSECRSEPLAWCRPIHCRNDESSHCLDVGSSLCQTVARREREDERQGPSNRQWTNQMTRQYMAETSFQFRKKSWN